MLSLTAKTYEQIEIGKAGDILSGPIILRPGMDSRNRLRVIHIEAPKEIVIERTRNDGKVVKSHAD